MATHNTHIVGRLDIGHLLCIKYGLNSNLILAKVQRIEIMMAATSTLHIFLKSFLNQVLAIQIDCTPFISMSCLLLKVFGK